tara:strand:+ start:997 stop:1680 length:684 start_codon:yes stop_codon:yes gene_type:complete
MAVRSQRKVFYGNDHVGTLNYGADGNILSRDWLGADGSWSNYTDGVGVPAGHRAGQELSVNNMSALAIATTQAEKNAIYGSSIQSELPNQQKIAAENAARPHDTADTFRRMGYDANNLSEIQMAEIAVAANNDDRYAKALRTDHPDILDRAGSMLGSVGKKANFEFTEPGGGKDLSIPEGTGGNSAGTGGKELARIDTNRPSRRNQGSSSYQGGQSSVRTSQQVNTK